MSSVQYISVTPDHVRKIKFVTWWGMIINIFLSVIKFIAGYVGHSQAVMADAIHSLSDTVTDLAILLGVKFWSAPPDTQHPYGHSKIESLVTAFIGIILFLVSIGIAYDAILTIKLQKSGDDLWIAVIGPIISIFVKEFLYRWTIGTGKKIKSTSLIANAWHHRSDAISSVMALIAVGISLIFPSFFFVDNIGAIIVSIFIIKISWDILGPAIKELTDAGVSEKIRHKIQELALSTEGVKAVHAIRTRKVADSIYVDMHVLVDGNLTVKEGHSISDRVQSTLTANIPEIIDIIVHIEPYDDRNKKEI